MATVMKALYFGYLLGPFTATVDLHYPRPGEMLRIFLPIMELKCTNNYQKSGDTLKKKNSIKSSTLHDLITKAFKISFHFEAVTALSILTIECNPIYST